MIEALSTYIERRMTAQEQRHMTAIEGRLDPTSGRYSELQRQFSHEITQYLRQLSEVKQDTLNSLSNASDARKKVLIDDWIGYAKWSHTFEAQANAALSKALQHLDSSDEASEAVERAGTTVTKDPQSHIRDLLDGDYLTRERTFKHLVIVV